MDENEGGFNSGSSTTTSDNATGPSAPPPSPSSFQLTGPPLNGLPGFSPPSTERSSASDTGNGPLTQPPPTTTPELTTQPPATTTPDPPTAIRVGHSSPSIPGPSSPPPNTARAMGMSGITDLFSSRSLSLNPRLLHPGQASLRSDDAVFLVPEPPITQLSPPALATPESSPSVAVAAVPVHSRPPGPEFPSNEPEARIHPFDEAINLLRYYLLFTPALGQIEVGRPFLPSISLLELRERAVDVIEAARMSGPGAPGPGQAAVVQPPPSSDYGLATRRVRVRGFFRSIVEKLRRI